MPKAELKISASEIFKGLDDMADGVFIVDGNLRIHIWNKAAEEILGFRKDDVQGQFCYQILRGSNGEGNPICSKHCRVLNMVKESKPISSYDTQVRTGQGENCWLNMSILAVRSGQNRENMMITHIFRDISQKKDDEIILNQILEKARRYQKNTGNIRDEKVPDNQFEKLTRRQHEVLTLLARGFSTREIADSLSISQYTVRNHIQIIFQKFQVNNRLEAVTFALKNGLLDQKNGADVL
jgi:PAS domain S-box-containing protein